MCAPLPVDIRGEHPYHMYDEIRLQPQAIARTLEGAEAASADICRVLSRARRVIVTGCGTSWHAAQGAAWQLQLFTRGRLEVVAVEAHTVVAYMSSLQPEDVLIAISHSGETSMTVRAMDRARRSGCATVVVTGATESTAARAAQHVLPTGYPDERSWAHTVSYTAALAATAVVANNIADPEERLDLSPLPEVVGEALRLEEIAHRLAASVIVAERYRDVPLIVLVGGGPNEVTAAEGALKLLETSYARAVAFGLEETLHGPLAAVTPESLVILLAPSGASADRATELARALRILGVTPVALVGEENASLFEDAHRFVLPDLPEVLSPIPYVVPLQLFSYFLAVGKGTNPDLLHRDDERYLQARAAYT